MPGVQGGESINNVVGRQWAWGMGGYVPINESDFFDASGAQRTYQVVGVYAPFALEGFHDGTTIHFDHFAGVYDAPHHLVTDPTSGYFRIDDPTLAHPLYLYVHSTSGQLQTHAAPTGDPGEFWIS